MQTLRDLCVNRDRFDQWQASLQARWTRESLSTEQRRSAMNQVNIFGEKE